MQIFDLDQKIEQSDLCNRADQFNDVRIQKSVQPSIEPSPVMKKDGFINKEVVLNMEGIINKVGIINKDGVINKEPRLKSQMQQKPPQFKPLLNPITSNPPLAKPKRSKAPRQPLENAYGNNYTDDKNNDSRQQLKKNKKNRDIPRRKDPVIVDHKPPKSPAL